jgi:hypothetical protein
MKRIIKSVCNRYIAICVNETNRFEGLLIVDTERKITYERGYTEIKSKYYAKKHHINAVSNYRRGDGDGKYFTVNFSDHREGELIDPFRGNTIIKEYEAVFKKPKWF